MLLCITLDLRAEIPRLISFQGVLTDEAGLPVQDSQYPILFRLFDAESGIGEPLWAESQLVSTVNGVFDVLLGASTALNLPFDEQYWLETVTTSGTLTPRIGLASTAYSLRSASIEDSVAVRSINGMQDEIQLRGEGGLQISQVGDTLKLRAISSTMSLDVSGATTDITADWSSYEACVTTVECSGPGVVICESVVQLQVSHTTGIGDRIQLCHSDLPNSAGPDVAYYSVYSIPAEYPTFLNNEITVPVRTVFEIESAGSHTCYLNGRNTQGVGGDRFWYASLTATFHPEHTIDARPMLDGRLPHIEKPSR